MSRDSRQVVIGQEDYSAGMFRDVAPHLIPENGVYTLHNYLLDEDGSPYKRGGTTNKSNPTFGGTADRTNLATNPKGAVDTAGWSGPEATITAEAAPTLSGLPAGISTAFKVEWTGTPGAFLSLPFEVESGKTYTVSLYGLSTGAGVWSFGVRDDTSFIAAINNAGFDTALFNRREVTFTAASTATFTLFISTGQAGNIGYFSAILSEEGEPAGIYFDGDLLGQWSGTPNASTSEQFVGTGLTFLWDGYFDAGQRTLIADDEGFGVLGVDDETPVRLGLDGLPYPKDSAYVPDTGGAGLLFIGGGTIYGGSRKTASYSTGTVATTEDSAIVTGTGTAWLANLDAGMLFQVGSERVYAIRSVDSNTQITLSDPYEGTTGSGKSYVAHNIYTITGADPYPVSEFYAVCANRLCWATGNLVHASEPLRPHDDTATIGAEEIPTTHELPEGVRVVGLGVIGQTLLPFATHGVWTIEGLAFDIAGPDGTPQHTLRILSRDLVALNPEGIATWEQALVVPASDGIYLVDGVSQPVKISRPIDELLVEHIRVGRRLGQAEVSRGHYFLPIITAAGSPVQVLVCRLDRPVRARKQTVYPWSILSGQAGEVVAFAQRAGETVRQPTLLGADSRPSSRVLDCSGLFDPASQNRLDADGSNYEYEIITRDFETGNLTKNMVRRLRSRYQLADVGEPEIDIAYSVGDTDPDLPYWGHPDGEWGTGFGPSGTDPWTNTTDALFTSICSAPKDPDATHPHRCRVNDSARFIRFRLRSTDPCAVHRLRSLEVFIRPSAALRR